MAHLHRLIFAALVLLSAWLPSTSYASFPATQTNADSCTSSPCYAYKSKNYATGATTLGPFSTGTAACSASIASFNAWSANYSGSGGGGYGSCSMVVVVKSSGAYSYTDTPSIQQISVAPTAPVYSCPANATLSGSTCSCSSGWSESGSSCVDPNTSRCNDANGGLDLFEGFSNLPTVGAAFCPSNGDAASCAATVVGGFCGVKAGVKKCTYEVKYGGGTCTPPAPSPTESPVPTPCKGTYGQVNGVDVCLPLGSDPSVTIETGKKTETTTTPPGGGGSTTVTKDETATCIGSHCTSTTTTTTTGPDGVPVVSTETRSEAKDDYCKNNPRSPQCITSSFGGSCSAAFTCDGDAVMCAITREQHIRNCKLFDDNSSAEAQLYGSEKNKTGSQTGSLPGSEAVAISSSSFDTSDAIGGGSACIADKSVTVAGAVVSIPFSSVCGHLAMLGGILMAVSFLLAGRILVRG